MKKALFILLAPALFAGCVKENNSSTNNGSTSVNSLLINKWYVEKDTSTTFVNNIESGQNVTNYHTDANYAQFNPDGSGIIYIGEDPNDAYTEIFTYAQGLNNKIMLNYPTQVVNGQQQSAISRTGTIKTLTPASLVIQYTSSAVVSGKTDSTCEIQYFSTN